MSDKLIDLAIEVAIAAPAKRGAPHVREARIPWEIVEAIRAELESNGYDWRSPHEMYVELIRERRQANYDRKMGV